MTDAEPPHAREWQMIRDRCEAEPVEYCGYPWCKCPVAKLQAELDALDEGELTTAQEGLRTAGALNDGGRQ